MNNDFSRSFQSRLLTFEFWIQPVSQKIQESMESSNLRERKQDTPSVRDESNSQKKSQQIQTVEVYLTALIDANKSIIPASVLPFLTSFLIPAIIAIQQLIVASIPSLQQLYVRAVILNAQLAPYKVKYLKFIDFHRWKECESSRSSISSFLRLVDWSYVSSADPLSLLLLPWKPIDSEVTKSH